MAGLQLEQPLGIDGDGIRLHRSRGGNRAGNDLALHQQALDACIDQAGTELREVEHADDQREQAGHVEEDDAAAETRKGNARSEEHTSELQSQSNLVCRLLLEKKK